jgi:hypothetical protein
MDEPLQGLSCSRALCERRLHVTSKAEETVCYVTESLAYG